MQSKVERLENTYITDFTRPLHCHHIRRYKDVSQLKLYLFLIVSNRLPF